MTSVPELTRRGRCWAAPKPHAGSRRRTSCWSRSPTCWARYGGTCWAAGNDKESRPPAGKPGAAKVWRAAAGSLRPPGEILRRTAGRGERLFPPRQSRYTPPRCGEAGTPRSAWATVSRPAAQSPLIGRITVPFPHTALLGHDPLRNEKPCPLASSPRPTATSARPGSGRPSRWRCRRSCGQKDRRLGG